MCSGSGAQWICLNEIVLRGLSPALILLRLRIE
jgi:hypothetical protein